MAATIARAWGHDATRTKETHRLGHKSAEVEAATWHTFVRARVYADGSGYVDIIRDGQELHSFAFDSEAPRA